MRVSIGRAALALAMVSAAGAAQADKIKNPTAVFSGLDKITGRTVSFEVAIDETVQFGGLQMTPKVCYTRPPTESPNTSAFVEVEEVTLESKVRRIFTGWMFAASPGLHAVEHPIYDVWLTDCKGGAPPQTAAAEPSAPAAPAAPQRPARSLSSQTAPRAGAQGGNPGRAPQAQQRTQPPPGAQSPGGAQLPPPPGLPPPPPR